MITNLFSVFDPTSSLISISLNWIRTFLGIMLLPIAVWVIPSRLTIIWNNITQTLHKEFKLLLGPNIHSGRTLPFITLFTLIIFNNSLGLVPYIFTRTRHLTITLTLALPIWLGFIFYGWINHTTHIFTHLVPQGTPPALIPFIVCIETIRNIIRPGTLAVRLAANIIAGHLLITLLGNQGPSSSQSTLTILLITQILLLTLEVAVAVIQSYVFAILRTLYSREVI